MVLQPGTVRQGDQEEIFLMPLEQQKHGRNAEFVRKRSLCVLTLSMRHAATETGSVGRAATGGWVITSCMKNEPYTQRV